MKAFKNTGGREAEACRFYHVGSGVAMKHLKLGICIRNLDYKKSCVFRIPWLVLVIQHSTHMSHFYLLKAKSTKVSPHLTSLMGSVTLSKMTIMKPVLP